MLEDDNAILREHAGEESDQLLPITMDRQSYSICFQENIYYLCHTVLIHQYLEFSKQNRYRLIHMQTLFIREKEAVFSQVSLCKRKSTVWIGNTYQSTELASDSMSNFCHFPQIDNLLCNNKSKEIKERLKKSLQIYEQKLLLNRKVHQISKYECGLKAQASQIFRFGFY